MADRVLVVEDLWKQYRLGAIGTSTMKDDFAKMWAKLTGKKGIDTPLAGTNDRTLQNSDYIWALQDINFEVKQGEVVGIIGKNGAGKSTLLKILSKVTNPTKGIIKTKGRIASLLEVGTGFHPELSGRDNIYLNGAILGMKKPYIKSKFDEIVEFSGIGNYIDTPVKRYSSGMYVRLAFAVAAHLEPEILIIDEVLAVGDAEFQKKCLGKMKDVSGKEGRTVLFVSHNMGAVKNICSRGIVLSNGTIKTDTNATEAVSAYMSVNYTIQTSVNYVFENITPLENIVFSETVLKDENGEIRSQYHNYEVIKFELYCEVLNNFSGMRVNLSVINNEDIEIFCSTNQKKMPETLTKGKYIFSAQIPGNIFNEGLYHVKLSAGIPGKTTLLKECVVLTFTITGNNYGSSYYGETWSGLISPLIIWEHNQSTNELV
ncbi:MAG: ABC transporter ATP-binding protein [Cytophagales bacterium]|nr:ABC transporter ATP-binding protein [Cytophagales bacterium]